MHIGILTFHDVANAGAFLQAYATMKTLVAMGHEASIIDYTNPAHRYSHWRFPLRHPRFCLTHPRVWSATRASEDAFADCQKYLHKTRRFVTRGEVGSQRFDAIVVGADIVWNYEPWARGHDPIYFGAHLNTERLIASAPSCGNLNFNRPIPEYVRNGLPRFHAIAVRDAKTADLVEQVLHQRPQLIADPTFDLQMEELPEVCNFERDYLLVYAINNTVDAATKEEVTAFARKKGLKTVAVCYWHDWVDEYHVVNPFEWLGRIRCARYVFTTAFHGTVFALKLGKAFALKYSHQMESKIRPMMEALNREDRAYSDPGRLSRILETEWDVSATHRDMEARAGKAKEYLRNALA